GNEVAQVRSPGPLHKRWCCESELKPPADWWPLVCEVHRRIGSVRACANATRCACRPALRQSVH
ncbi:hypothetical protein BRM57_16240, partial [Xanthomonas oryzae pv. oryzae]